MSHPKQAEAIADYLDDVLKGVEPLPTPKELNNLSKRLSAAIKEGTRNGQKV